MLCNDTSKAHGTGALHLLQPCKGSGAQLVQAGLAGRPCLVLGTGCRLGLSQPKYLILPRPVFSQSMAGPQEPSPAHSTYKISDDITFTHTPLAKASHTTKLKVHREGLISCPKGTGRLLRNPPFIMGAVTMVPPWLLNFEHLNAMQDDYKIKF